jgi:low affinity Fe/Cu permease
VTESLGNVAETVSAPYCVRSITLRREIYEKAGNKDRKVTDRTSQASTETLQTVPDTSSPAYATGNALTRVFDSFASAVTRWCGSPVAFGLAVITIIVWVVTGPVFHYSDGWQLIINTGTTIVTFLMVFLIQQSQNKDSVALHMKLNELLASNRAASNQLIGIEDATEDELRRLAAAYLRIAQEKTPESGRSDAEAPVNDRQTGQP